MRKLFLTLAVTLFAFPVLACDKAGHEPSSHGGSEACALNMHGAGTPVEANAETTEGTGVLHEIDVEGSTVNLTHDPIPALHWPEMTMDLPVDESVDLTQFKEGEEIVFDLALEDEMYRIVSMKAIRSDM